MCPVSMTYSVIPALRDEPELAAEWEPRLTRASYEDGALAGHGDDREAGRLRRARQQHARRARGRRRLRDHRPQVVLLLSAAAMSSSTLAQAPGGLSCFLIEGRDPGFRIQRLKDKLGTRSLPSSEVEFHGVRGRLVGEEGRGVATIIRMVNHTRLDCLLGSAASMRWGVAQAVHHARHRSAFGKLLAEQPAMQNVLADLAVESEAATAAAFRIARAYDEDDAAVPPLRHRGHEVLGLQARARRTRPRRSSAWAATATWRSRACRGCCATRRSTRSGRARATWPRSTCCAPRVKEPEGLPAFLAECELGRGRERAARRPARPPARRAAAERPRGRGAPPRGGARP